MKQRDPLVATLLSVFVPFYIIYWLYQTGKIFEARGSKAPNLLLLFAPAIFLLIFFVMLIAGSAAGAEEGAAVIVILYLLAIPASIAASLVYYYKFGQATEVVTNKQLSTGLVFILLWFVSPAAVYLVQEKLNATPAGPAAHAPVPPTT